jgi:hypothetical protein
MVKFTERETYLAAAAILLQQYVFVLANIDAAQWGKRKYRVSCGFPIGYRGSRSGKVALGQAFDPSISADGTFEVFINPILDNPLDVIAVLLHELAHVWAGIQCGHRGEFARICRAVGLVGPMTATVPGDELRVKLQQIVDELGDYPHAKVDPNARKKQGTRLLKLQCSDCGWTARVSALQGNRLHADSACPVCAGIGSLQFDID